MKVKTARGVLVDDYQLAQLKQIEEITGYISISNIRHNQCDITIPDYMQPTDPDDLVKWCKNVFMDEMMREWGYLNEPSV